MTSPGVERIGPQPGPQVKALASRADILLCGGAAGGGKTFVELFEPLRHILPSPRFPAGVPGFSGVGFRRTNPQIRNEGGLWDSSRDLYGKFGGRPLEGILEWRWPTMQTMRFAQLQYEDTVRDWDGSQVPYMFFDELIHFTRTQFFYMLSRNRSTCGIKPYIRAATNPEDNWVGELVSWWIDQDEKFPAGHRMAGEPNPRYGFPIPERDGVVRYFLNLNDQLLWADRPDDLVHRIPEEHLDNLRRANIHPLSLVKSFTFVGMKVYDNKILLDSNPQYLGNLLAQSPMEQARLLKGNWKVKPEAGTIFSQDRFGFVELSRVDFRELEVVVRYWDKAASSASESGGKADWTVGCLLGRLKNGTWVVLDVVRDQLKAYEREKLIRTTSERDKALLHGVRYQAWVEQEPSGSGKDSAEATLKMLQALGIPAFKERPQGSKLQRADPASAAQQAGNIILVRAAWNYSFISELHHFDGKESTDTKKDDQVDALSGAFNALAKLKAGYAPGAFKPLHQ